MAIFFHRLDFAFKSVHEVRSGCGILPLRSLVIILVVGLKIISLLRFTAYFLGSVVNPIIALT